MKKIAKRNMGMGVIFVSLFFLFNPDIIIIDFIPNFIGYILICVGLSQLAAMNDLLEEAYIGFRKMIFIDIAKFMSILLLLGMFNKTEQPVGMLLFAFVFAIIEFIVLIPAVIKLFDGIIYLASRLPNESVVFDTGKVGGKTKIEKLKIFTVIFIIVKSALAVLPETASLSDAGSGSFNNSFNPYDYIMLFRTFAFVATLILGIVWLIFTLSLMFKIRKDSQFIEAVKHKYNTEISVKDSIFTQKDMKMLYVLFSLAIVFFIDFYADSHNVIPTAICAVLLILSSINFKNYTKYKIHCIVSASIFAVVSGFAEYFSFMFQEDFSPGMIYKSTEAASAYTKLLVFSAFEAIMFMVTIFFIILAFKEIIKTQTGFSISGDDHINLAQIDELHKSLRKKLYITGVFAFIAGIFKFLYDLSIMFEPNHSNDFIIFYVNTAGIFDFIFSLIFVIVFIRTLSSIYDGIKNKYILM